MAMRPHTAPTVQHHARIVSADVHLPHSCTASGRRVVHRLHACRYMVVHLYGGVYADMDTECRAPANTWAPTGCLFSVGLETGEHFCQWAFAAVPGHGALGCVLDLVLQRMIGREYAQYIARGDEDFVHEVTGPSVFTEGILNYLGVRHTGHNDVNLTMLLSQRTAEFRRAGVCLLTQAELNAALANQFSSWHQQLQRGSWSSWTRERQKLMKRAGEERRQQHLEKLRDGVTQAAAYWRRKDEQREHDGQREKGGQRETDEQRTRDELQEEDERKQTYRRDEAQWPGGALEEKRYTKGQQHSGREEAEEVVVEQEEQQQQGGGCEEQAWHGDYKQAGGTGRVRFSDNGGDAELHAAVPQVYDDGTSEVYLGDPRPQEGHVWGE